ncbi:MAG: threonine/serine exporter family protein, partial [Clostridiales bacterium]|nr:threonine/serine exporter family protein [Clostridiales bacterium]
MDYDILLDITTDLSYRLAMCGAETFRVEESAKRIMASYGISAEVFAIPNCLHISIRTPDGRPLTSMRRIGYHGNDMDGVERYSNLSRMICEKRPDLTTMKQWVEQTEPAKYSLGMTLLGSFLGTGGFSILFGATWTDALCAGICGVLIGAISHLLEKFETNSFFRIIIAAFSMGILAYFMGAVGITKNTDAVVIGALLLLMPGLLFVNGLRDIIFGDTNSGMNRIVQVLLIAAAIALGTGAAWEVAESLWGSFSLAGTDGLPYFLQA